MDAFMLYTKPAQSNKQVQNPGIENTKEIQTNQQQSKPKQKRKNKSNEKKPQHFPPQIPTPNTT